jgi:8-oxo-dGTP pyrophosphatase MutT (NUDIX family)
MSTSFHRIHLREAISMRAHGPWIIHEGKELYTSEFLDLREDRVTKPDGSQGRYATATLKPGVAVLPVGFDGQVHLTRQFRYAVGRESVEAPSGAIEAGETPLAAATRELREELGIDAKTWIPLGSVDVDTSIVRCPVDLFLTQDLRFTRRDQDPTEVIRPVQVALEAAVAMVMNGEITHAPSCALILKAERRLREGTA